MKFQVLGSTSPEESVREREHRAIARKAAAEGIVLLENKGVLPMSPQKIALYGSGSRMTVKGGSGSGDVRERHSVSIEEGLKNAGFRFPSTLWMDRFQEKYERDIAVWRNGLETGDYLFSDTETDSLRLLRKHYTKLILILNCGGVMDLSILDELPMDAVLLYGQGGMEGGNALADILTGAVCPSGKLTDTWAIHYEDYPCAETFGHRNGNLENEDYTEGIYVGYRWFEKKGVRPRYPFGYGLSYTGFDYEVGEITESGITVSVTNVGQCPGKEVLRVYISKPERVLEHEARALAGFAKTKRLAPGESQTLTIPFRTEDIASLDEARSAFVLEAGEHGVFLNEIPVGSFCIEQERILERVQPIGTQKGKPVTFAFSPEVTALLKKLSDREKVRLVVGGGYSIRCYNNVMGAAGRSCTKLLKKGIPNIVLADGPAGLNVLPVTTTTTWGTPQYPEGLPDDWNWGWLRRMGPIVKHLPGKGKRYTGI